MRKLATHTGVHLQTFLRFLGLDRAIAYTVIARGWSALSGPVSILLIARFLSPDEQGFFFTFGSLLGLQVFLELGLSWVIFQFASHERAFLEWTPHGTLEGDAKAKARLSSLLRSAMLWYGVVSILVVAILLPLGLFFFNRHEPPGAEISWRVPWMWVVVVSACGLFVTPLYCVLEGCGLIKEIAFVRLCSGVTGSLLLWLALTLRLGLYATPIITTAAFVWGIAWIWFRKRAFVTDLLFATPPSAVLNWWGEVWPLQWKFALTWLSSYFIFQLFNPVLFAYHGAAAAGQMGMSINIAGSIASTAIAWVTTKAAPFGNLVARKDYVALDKMFFTSLWQSFALAICGGVGFWIVVFYLHRIHHPVSRRLLDPLPLGLLIGQGIVQHVVGAEGLYLRAHKQEPFLVMSILSGVLVGLSTYFLGRQFGATGMMAGYFAVTVVIGLGMGTWIFVSKRRLWASEAQQG